MKWRGLRGIKSRMITAMMIISLFLSYASAPVFAAGVEIDNHYSEAAGKKQVSGLIIDGVKAPLAGQRLDDSAVVHTKEGYRWEIAVVWVNDKQQVATKAVEGEKYIPTLAFYVPSGYMLSGKAFGVEVSDVLAVLMGTGSLTSVYDAASGITFIIPITAVGDVRSADKLGSDLDKSKALTYQEWLDLSADTGAFTEKDDAGRHRGESDSDDSNSGESAGGDSGNDDSDIMDGDIPGSDEKSIVEIYCAQTARDALTDDDLETIIDLVVHKLEPQAVELLKDSFPAFSRAAENGEIGEEIGLYIYYAKGDKDGLEEHDTPRSVLAYVSAREKKIEGESKYTYMIGVNLDSLVRKDKDGKAIINPNTGKYMLVPDDENMETLTNTMVHEMFHAFMDDYNRTGMSGAISLEDIVLNEKGEFRTKELAEKYQTLHFPDWFIEGTATSVENGYKYWYDTFTAYRQQENSKEYYDKYSQDSILNNYVTNSNKTYLNLDYTDGYDENNNQIDAKYCNYATGYLASLYLADLAYKASTGEKKTGDENGFDSATFREGLSYILERLHYGDTLDDVIIDISPVDKDGKKIYKDTAAFQEKFICGTPDKNGDFYGEESSLTFVTDYLNYMRSMESESKGQKTVPNGSILFDFEMDFSEPIDPNKEASSDFYRIVESNVSIPTTVKNDTPQIGGGKSDPNIRKDEGKENLQIAAKQKNEECGPVAGEPNNKATADGKSQEIAKIEISGCITDKGDSAVKDASAVSVDLQGVSGRADEDLSEASCAAKDTAPDNETASVGNTSGEQAENYDTCKGQEDPVANSDDGIDAGEVAESEEAIVSEEAKEQEELETDADGVNASCENAGTVTEGEKADTGDTNVITGEGKETADTITESDAVEGAVANAFGSNAVDNVSEGIGAEENVDNVSEGNAAGENVDTVTNEAVTSTEEGTVTIGEKAGEDEKTSVAGEEVTAKEAGSAVAGEDAEAKEAGLAVAGEDAAAKEEGPAVAGEDAAAKEEGPAVAGEVAAAKEEGPAGVDEAGAGTKEDKATERSKVVTGVEAVATKEEET